jgi:hypothetical protein
MFENGLNPTGSVDFVLLTGPIGNAGHWMPPIRRTVCKSMLEVLESKTVTNSERLEAGGLLLKIQANTSTSSRGAHFTVLTLMSGNERRSVDSQLFQL